MNGDGTLSVLGAMSKQLLMFRRVVAGCRVRDAVLTRLVTFCHAFGSSLDFLHI